MIIEMPPLFVCVIFYFLFFSSCATDNSLQYELLVDLNAQYKKRAVLLEPQVFFGQLQNIFVIGLDPSPALKLFKRTNLTLAAIYSCANPHIEAKNGIYYYLWEGPIEVVDINCVQCLVGHIKNGNGWVVVDQSDGCVHPVFVDEDN